ncbi:STAS/SEC14 domain-containing protein [Gillisia sp. M10.2A]|uniref:STAS/SEC14 domain-containing protein n=1 Tax=Gillisia lutea TaxID=2909668 RepID=A0ABS9EB71_9FLAO|nr:STAS/SEC14 domain-containing protein [Gillisia lutea]MCF4100118.1 STAS/SEC14 domain-containing protein [Gillisia lutea]
MVSTFEFADHVVGIIISSDVDNALVDEVHEVILERLQEHDKISLIVEIKKESRIHLSAMVKDLIFKFDHAGQFYKIAVVSDHLIMRNAMIIKDLFMKAEVKPFSSEKRLDAMNWIIQ